MDVTTPPLWLLTAPRGAGKSTFCRALADAARAAGWDVAGLLSPAVFTAGAKTGIAAQNLRSGETRLLARVAPAPTFDLEMSNWHFDRSVFVWGNQILEASLPCDLFIVDELGPLELRRNEGWVTALPALRRAQYNLGLVVIRPELVAAARTLLPIRDILPLPETLPPGDSGLAYIQQLAERSRIEIPPGIIRYLSNNLKGDQ